MNLLFLSQLLPYPPDAGAKVRSFYTLRWLAKKHRVTLVAFTRQDDPPGAVEHLSQFCQAVHTVPMKRSRIRDGLALAGSLLQGESFIIRRDRSDEMGALLHRLAREEKFDAVHADQLWMTQFALRYTLACRQVGTSGRSNLRTGNMQLLVLDEHNACFQVFERLAQGESNALKHWLWKREAHRLKQYEVAVCRQFDRVVTVTVQDRMLLEEMSRQAAGVPTVFSTIPICVDPGEFPAVTPTGDGQQVLHLGTMFWPPNVEGMLWFGRKVWPKVVAQNPGARLSIVGKNPPAEIRALHETDSIEVTGYVADPLPWLERAGVFIVPLLSGGGMRVKIVDGWRWGLPIVSTTIGAEGIACQDGENILIADTADDFAAAVGRILRQPELARCLRVNGRHWVEQNYDWQAIYPAWDQVFEVGRE